MTATAPSGKEQDRCTTSTIRTPTSPATRYWISSATSRHGGHSTRCGGMRWRSSRSSSASSARSGGDSARSGGGVAHAEGDQPSVRRTDCAAEVGLLGETCSCRHTSATLLPSPSSRSASASLRTTCSGVCRFLVAMSLSSLPAHIGGHKALTSTRINQKGSGQPDTVPYRGI
jgi:hypothetical protein